MDDQSLRDLFEGLGTISIRRMFGGKGIYHQGLIVALVVQDELLLKADQESAPALIAAGSTQWTYDGRKNGKTVALPYWSVPDEAHDVPEIMPASARLASAASLRPEAKT